MADAVSMFLCFMLFIIVWGLKAKRLEGLKTFFDF